VLGDIIQIAQVEPDHPLGQLQVLTPVQVPPFWHGEEQLSNDNIIKNIYLKDGKREEKKKIKKTRVRKQTCI
jgi:hypothetical protein